MALLDDLDAAPPTPIGVPCGVGKAVAEHPDLADDIKAAVMRTDRSARVIADVLSRHGVKLSVGTVNRHRRGECKCHS